MLSSEARQQVPPQQCMNSSWPISVARTRSARAIGKAQTTKPADVEVSASWIGRVFVTMNVFQSSSSSMGCYRDTEVLHECARHTVTYNK
eukprot:5551132-Amphidinium_carterae.1